MKLIIILIAIELVVFCLGCSLDAPSETRSVLEIGDADFSIYVALGDDIAAGFQSSALTEIHQDFSYPNFIARETKTATFVQPSLGYPGIGLNTAEDKGIQELLALDGPIVESADYGNYPEFDKNDPYASDAIKNHAAPYNNLAIPLSFTFDILNATSADNCWTGRLGTANPFVDIVLRNPNLGGTYTPFEQAKMLQPTFVTCWIGTNDVYLYAASGGTLPPFPTTAGIFNNHYAALMDSLLTLGAQLVIANIPDVTTWPLFTTLPGVVLDPDSNEPILDGDGNPIPLVGVNPQTDLVLLSALDAMDQGLGIPAELGGTNQPLPNDVFLKETEVAKVKQAISDYNNTIATIATEKNIPVVDMYTFFNELGENGYTSGGQEFTIDFISGGLMSLDGAHPSDIGSALIANEFIKVINENFNAQIPLINIMEITNQASL